ncbi:MAG: penicillin-binding protein activator [Novosphingobium sp.]|nr:penicillin-binding protein activator [Novosphingobium sp.]
MIEKRALVRNLVLTGAIVLVAGCKVIPKRPPVAAPTPVPTEKPSGVLPSDRDRHRVALLVPLSGANGGVGQSLANATTMALLDTNAQNLRITTYDTAGGAQSAAARALTDGNKLILGPLLNEDVRAVAAVARPARVPMITFSNDSSVAADDVYVLGHVPAQSVARTVSFAKSKGANRFAALIPTGEYGQRAGAAFAAAVASAGGSVAATESYDRGNTSVTSAAQRLKAKGGYDAVLIADGARIATRAAPALRAPGTRILGTELWAGESAIVSAPALRGAYYSAVSDARFSQFSTSYRARFGAQPYRIATLGYDGVLLALNVARNWRPGTLFPTAKLADRGGFIGLDGAFRFGPDSVSQRAWEVREVGVGTVSPAPNRFGG